MKLCLIFALCLSLGIGDKLDRTYLPPEGSFQSSGNPSDLKLPYDDHDNNIKEMDVKFQNSETTDPTETDSLPGLLKLHSENINSDELQNTRYYGVDTSKEKEAFVHDLVTDHSLYGSSIDSNNDSDKPGQLKPYLPLKMQSYQSPVARFKINNDSNKLAPFYANDNYNIVGTANTAKSPSDFQNINVSNNMPSVDLQRNLSTYPSGNYEKKSDMDMDNAISANNKEKFSSENNEYVSELLNKDSQTKKNTEGLLKNNKHFSKDFKTLETRPSRLQAENDKNAEILSYESSITPINGKFAFSFNTSNGIHVEEHGTSNDGVKAEGGYSYTGDDGKIYTIRYIADENGFQPSGEHLPTPPPIPEAILRVIELAMKNKENNVSEDNGMYDEKKYGHQNYDRGFVAKYKKPSSKIPSKLPKMESNPGNRQTGTVFKPNSIGNKKSHYGVSDIDSIMPINVSENDNDGLLQNINKLILNGNQESIKQNLPDYVQQRPSVSRKGTHQQSFSIQRAIDQSKSELYMEDQNIRRPFTENFKTTINKQYKKSDETETILSFPTTHLILDMKPNLANKMHSHYSFVSGVNVNNAQAGFKTQPNDISSSTQKPFDTDSSLKEIYENNKYHNAPGIYETSAIVNSNTKLYLNSRRKNVMQDKHDAELLAGYHYPAPTRPYSTNPDKPNVIPKPQQGHMFHAVEIERPINRGYIRSNMEKLPNLTIIEPEAIKRPAIEFNNPKTYENGRKIGNIQSFPFVKPELENFKDIFVADSKDSRLLPNMGTKIFRDNIINVEKSPKAESNDGTAKGQYFSGPKQKPYFDPDSGYHY